MNMRKGGFNTFLIQPGYGYSFIYERFYFTPVVFVGGGLQLQRTFSKPGGSEYKLKLIPKITYQNALGYTGDIFLARIVYEINNIHFPFSSSKIKYAYSNWSLGVGVRF